MDFRLTPQHAAFQDEVSAFATEMAPAVASDRGDPEYNEHVRRELAKRKWLAMPIAFAGVLASLTEAMMTLDDLTQDSVVLETLFSV